MYFVANDIKEEKKVSALNWSYGPSTYALLRSLPSPVKPSSKSFREHCDTLQRHLSPAPINMQNAFDSTRETSKMVNRSVSTIANLKKMSIKCAFGERLDEAQDKRQVGLWPTWYRDSGTATNSWKANNCTSHTKNTDDGASNCRCKGMAWKGTSSLCPWRATWSQDQKNRWLH